METPAISSKTIPWRFARGQLFVEVHRCHYPLTSRHLDLVWPTAAAAGPALGQQGLLCHPRNDPSAKMMGWKMREVYRSADSCREICLPLGTPFSSHENGAIENMKIPKGTYDLREALKLARHDQ